MQRVTARGRPGPAPAGMWGWRQQHPCRHVPGKQPARRAEMLRSASRPIQKRPLRYAERSACRFAPREHPRRDRQTRARLPGPALRSERLVHRLQLKIQQRFAQVGYAASVELVAELVPALLDSRIHLVPVEEDVALVAVQFERNPPLGQHARPAHIFQPGVRVTPGQNGRLPAPQPQPLAAVSAGAIVPRPYRRKPLKNRWSPASSP